MKKGSAAPAVAALQLIFAELNASLACGNLDMLDRHTAPLDAPPAPSPHHHKRTRPPTAR